MSNAVEIETNGSSASNGKLNFIISSIEEMTNKVRHDVALKSLLDDDFSYEDAVILAAEIQKDAILKAASESATIQKETLIRTAEMQQEAVSKVAFQTTLSQKDTILKAASLQAKAISEAFLTQEEAIIEAAKKQAAAINDAAKKQADTIKEQADLIRHHADAVKNVGDAILEAAGKQTKRWITIGAFAATAGWLISTGVSIWTVKQQADATKNSADNSLYSYVGVTERLLTEKNTNPNEKDIDEPIKALLKANSFTALRSLQAADKGYFIRFLAEHGLIQKKSENGISLSGANLRQINLQDAWLPEIDLSGAYISGNLKNVSLKRASLVGADLTGANLRDADLRGSDLRDANLTNARLAGAQLTNAKYNAETQFPVGFDPQQAGMRTSE